MMEEVEGSLQPEGWTTARLGEVVERLQQIRPEDEPERVFYYVDISSIDNTAFTIRETEPVKGRNAPSRARRSIQPGDVLFSNVRTYLRNVAMVGSDPQADLCSTGFTVLRPTQALDGRYLFRYVLTKEFIDRLTPEQTGTHYPATTERVVLGQAIPVPPLQEQQRIGSVLDQTYELVGQIRGQIAETARSLTLLRRSILSAACVGDITSGWRDGHQIVWERLEGDQGISYPDTWLCKPSAELVEPGTVISYGIVQPGPNLTEGVPYIRGMDVDDAGNIKVGQLWRTSPEIASRHSRTELKEGDVLLNVIRHLRVAIVPSELDGANLTQGTVRIRPSSQILGQYLAYYLASPQAQRWMKARYVGTDMPRINVEDAREIPVPLPPLEEQQEIVRRVAEMLRQADEILAEMTAAEKLVDTLMQSIIRRAFRGELVETQAAQSRRAGIEYESGAALVKRVNAELASRPPDPKMPRRRTTRMGKVSRESVEAAIELLPASGFSFDELSQKVPADYDTLKDVLFSLLSEGSSGLTQFFDKKEKAIRFRRRVS